MLIQFLQIRDVEGQIWTIGIAHVIQVRHLPDDRREIWTTAANRLEPEFGERITVSLLTWQRMQPWLGKTQDLTT